MDAPARPRRRRKKRARRDEVIVASNGCRCGDCLECRLAKLRRLGETHRKGGRGPHHWTGMAPILDYAGKLAARYGGTTEEVVEMLSQGRTEEDMRILWEGVEPTEAPAIPRQPAPPVRVEAVERALQRVAQPREVVPLFLAPKELAAAVGCDRKTIYRRLARAGIEARRRPVAVAILMARAQELLEQVLRGGCLPNVRRDAAG